MRYETAVNFVKMLVAASPGSELPDESLALYVEMVKGLPEEAAEPLASRIIRTRQSIYMPAIGEILAEYARMVCRLPGPEEAWGWVLRRVNNQDERPLPNPVQQALNDVGGGWAVKTEPGPHIRRDFMAAYRARLDTIVRTVQTEGVKGLQALGYREQPRRIGAPAQEAGEAEPPVSREEAVRNLRRLAGLTRRAGLA